MQFRYRVAVHIREKRMKQEQNKDAEMMLLVQEQTALSQAVWVDGLKQREPETMARLSIRVQ